MQQGKVFRILNSNISWRELSYISRRIVNPVCLFGSNRDGKWYLIDFYGRYKSKGFILFSDNGESRPTTLKLGKAKNCLFRKRIKDEGHADICWFTPNDMFIVACHFYKLDAADIKISLKSIFK